MGEVVTDGVCVDVAVPVLVAVLDGVVDVELESDKEAEGVDDTDSLLLNEGDKLMVPLEVQLPDVVVVPLPLLVIDGV